MEYIKEIIYTYAIIEILLAFGLKLMDNCLATAKTVYISKENYFLGGLFAATSTYFYLIAIVRVANSNSTGAIIAMCLATFIGTQVSGNLIKKTEKDRLYIFDITGGDFQRSIEIADKIREKNIAVRTEVAYNEKVEKVLTCKVYCATKQESSVVNNLLNSIEARDGLKWHVYVPINNGY